jgi:hypothetical protein
MSQVSEAKVACFIKSISAWLVKVKSGGGTVAQPACSVLRNILCDTIQV